jgi:hypothetical protein
VSHPIVWSGIAVAIVIVAIVVAVLLRRRGQVQALAAQPAGAERPSPRPMVVGRHETGSWPGVAVC